MLTPEQLSNCANDMIDLYQQLDEQIARDIARRIVKANYLTDTADWQMRMLQECGMLHEDIITTLSGYSGMSEEVLKELFKDTANTSIAYDMSIYNKAGLNPLPLNMSPRAMQTLEAGFNKTNGNLQNLTRTTAITSQTAFINACTIAEMKVSSGAFDYHTAIIDAIKQVAENGAWVQYPSGHRDRLDVAVRRNVITGIGQTTGEICLGYAHDMECDLMEITAHAGARPSHSAWQGQIVSLSGKKGYLSLEDIGYGSGDGFKGWNCRHDWFPYFEGTERMYTTKDLKALEDRDIQYPDGSMHTYYEAEQTQRKYERLIRQARRDVCAYDEVIKNTNKSSQLYNDAVKKYDHYTAKVKFYEYELKNFCYKVGINPDNSRVRTLGYNRSVSQKVVHNDKSLYKSYQHMLGNQATAKDIHQFNDMVVHRTKEYNLFRNVEIVNAMYKTDFGYMSPMKIYELDQKALKAKRTNFPKDYRNSGNFAIMEYNNKYYYAHSLANMDGDEKTKAYSNYKSDKSYLATVSDDPAKRCFKTFDVSWETGLKYQQGSNDNARGGTYLDTESKLFETLEKIWYNEKAREINMLSERGMCDSCKYVARQFMEKHPECKVNIVSNIKNTGDVWKGRKPYA